MENDVVTNWKSHLQSSNVVIQLYVLKDIVSALNKASKNKKLLSKIINSDIGHFLSELMLYHRRISTNVVIKIASHLSETTEFYKDDFFRYIRSGFRLINSFPKTNTKCDLEELRYKRNIITFNTVLLKRAHEHHADFTNERFSQISMLIAAAYLTSTELNCIEYLEFVNVALETLYSSEPKEIAYRERKLVEIVGNVNLTGTDLFNVEHFVRVGRFFQNIIKFIPKQIQASQRAQAIVNFIAVKFIRLIKFVLYETTNLEKINYEIFVSLFYTLCSSDAMTSVIHKILNQFLRYNGLGFLIYLAGRKDESKSGKVIGVKSRLALAEVMLHILKLFHRVAEDDDYGESIAELREKYLEIVFNCDFYPQNMELENMDELTRETLIFMIFKYYMLLKYEIFMKSKGELLSTMAFIIEIFRMRKCPMDKGIVTMLLSIYTSNYVQIYVNDNQLLEKSTATLAKYVGKVNVIIDFHFFKWWMIHNWKQRKVYERLLNFLITPESVEDFQDISIVDLFAFDLKHLVNLFVNEKTPVENLEKITRVIAYFNLNLRDFQRLLTFYEKQRSAADRTRSIYALMILCVNYRELNARFLKKCRALGVKTLDSCTNIRERMLTIQLLVNLSHPESLK